MKLKLGLAFALGIVLGGGIAVGGGALWRMLASSEVTVSHEDEEEVIVIGGATAVDASPEVEVEVIYAEEEPAQETTSEPEEEASETPEEEPAPVVDMPEHPDMIKVENPERLAAMLEARRQQREARAEKNASRREFFRSIDETLLSEVDAEAHRDFVAALEQQEALAAEASALREAGEALPVELIHQRRNLAIRLRQGMAAERTRLLSAAGRSLGLSDEDAGAFTEILQEILTHTEERGPHSRR